MVVQKASWIGGIGDAPASAALDFSLRKAPEKGSFFVSSKEYGFALFSTG
jgi:hypothetical protein